MLVELPARRGLAKLHTFDGPLCSVSIFHSARRSDVVDLRLDEISRAFLSPQTRVYIIRDDAVQVGRVTDYLQQANGLVDYEVRFPNGRRGDFTELDLFVRPWDIPEDPAEILAFGGAESQFLHDRRQSAMGPLGRLRSACHGMTALTSAGIDLVPHQIAAVRRILTDPVQRYLLADEVGLGKTIEAGLVIRQHLIDDPETTILVATPPYLREQWRSELSGKLRLDQFPNAFEVCTHADLARVSRTPDILVVDEAHHLVGVTEGPLLEAAERLVKLAHAAPTLLLLSATPPLGEERKFLALLNLLDPDVHRLDEPAAFHAKLEQRREIGRLLLSLDADSPGLVLRQRAADVVRLFPEDAEVARLGPLLAAATREDPDGVAGICSALKAHVADTYRLHQRLIRSRRADTQGWEFRSRGPAVVGSPNLAHVRVEADDDEALPAIMAALQEWRFSAVDAATDDPDLLSEVARRYGVLLEFIAGASDHFDDWIKNLNPCFDGEVDLLGNLATASREHDRSGRASTMVENSRRLLKAIGGEGAHPKLVAFASSASAARAFHTALIAGAPELSPTLLINGDDSAAGVDQFLSSKVASILVTDQSGEEGLNLSRADAIIHLDLPMSAARLEQRIGRLDRFGRKKDLIRHRVLLPSDDEESPWQAWFDFVASGLLIFNGSISDVQFLLESIEQEALKTLIQTGPEGLAAFAIEVRSRVDEERRSQQEQYALDRLAVAEDPVEPFIDGIEDAESDEGALEAGVDAWLVGGLQLKKRPANWPDEDPFKLGAQAQTLIPRKPWLDLFPADSGVPMTWRRRTATRRADAVLLRPGAPLVDVLERFTRWDDRGTAFMTWRTVASWSQEPWLGFRLCFVEEADVRWADMLSPTPGELAASRRAQRYFQSRAQTVYIDINGAAVRDAALLDLLEAPYRKGDFADRYRDLNLGSRQTLLEDLIDRSSFRAICRSVRDAAREVILTSDEHTQRIGQGLEALNDDLRRRRHRLSVYQDRPDPTGQSELELLESILPGIARPSVRLDAMGLFVISRQAPSRNAYATA